MGRRLYESMLFWEIADQDPSLDFSMVEWGAMWKRLQKVVFSTTLSEVQGNNTRLAPGGLAEEIERWRAEPGEGGIGIGGATLAAEAAVLGLIDEYRPMPDDEFLPASTLGQAGDPRSRPRRRACRSRSSARTSAASARKHRPWETRARTA